jgi:hypothetical protein
MTWFFDQWIYRTAIPKLSVEYSLTDSPKGPVWKTNYVQRGAGPEFQGVLPFILRAGKGMLAGKLIVRGAQGSVETVLPGKPDSVEYNPLHSLLSELEIKKP